MCTEWSHAEFFLSCGNPEVCILIILIDVKILESNNSSNASQGFTKNNLQKKKKAVFCCCLLFFCGVWKTVVLICYYSVQALSIMFYDNWVIDVIVRSCPYYFKLYYIKFLKVIKPDASF